jgi:hypothetical protein
MKDKVVARLRNAGGADVNDRRERALRICQVTASVLEEERCFPVQVTETLVWEMLLIPPDGSQLDEVATEMMFRTGPDNAGGLEIDDVLPLVPVKYSNVISKQFRYDMEALSARIADSGTLGSLPEEETTWYVFQWLPTRPRARVLRVGPGIHSLLDLCDGNRTVSEIAASLEENAPNAVGDPQSEIVSDCARNVMSVFAEGLIRFARIP